MRGALLAALVAELGLITWRDVHQQKVLPLPSDYAAAVGVYALLGAAASTQAAPAAAGVGWVLVLVTFLNLWDPTNPTNITGKAGQNPYAAQPGSQALAPNAPPGRQS